MHNFTQQKNVLCRFHEKKSTIYIFFFADGGFWCLFKNTVKLDLYVFPSDIAEGHSGRFWHTSWIYWTNLGRLGSESSQSPRKFWEIWRRIRVTTDWHNTVGFPPSWQLPLDTCVNSKFDNNHHTWKTKKKQIIIYIIIIAFLKKKKIIKSLCVIKIVVDYIQQNIRKNSHQNTRQ